MRARRREAVNTKEGMMPKETIHVKDAIVNDSATDTNYPQDIVDARISVGFDKAHAHDRLRPTVGVSLEAYVENGNADMHWPRTVFLDRDQINQTIRALRKARDQAFGTDA
jgi:hypothetical protein